MEDSGRYSVQSVIRALEIIEVLAESRESLGITQITKTTGLSKTTTFRLVQTLVKAGYVRKNNGDNEYSLGMKFLKISSSILAKQDITSIARPFLRQLSIDTSEFVHLAILDGGEVLYIDKIDSSDHAIRIFSTIGNRSPLHCTGLGKVLMSELPDKDVEEIAREKGLTRYTENSITDLAELKKELESIRELGYGLDNMEHEIGIRCVAAPLYDRTKKIVAAISVTAPEIYMPDERIPELARVTRKVAREISYLLGYTELSG